MHEFVHISAAKPRLFYLNFVVVVVVKFYAIQKKSRDFVSVVVQLLLYKGYGQRLKEQNILLIYINANLMQIWCSCAPLFQPTPCSRNTSSYLKACVCSDTLEQAALDRLHY